jgi:hypothetical protein
MKHRCLQSKTLEMILSGCRRIVTAFWFIALLALLVRLTVVLLTTGAEFDITSYHIQAQSVFAHQNVYSVTGRYPYPPVWIWLVALAQWAANATALPFVWLVKMPGILGDYLIVVLLQWKRGSWAALFHALNPVSILITAGHGQFDALVMALVIAAWVLWENRQRTSMAWAALALGGAIALKSYPILLLPALLIKVPSNKQQIVLAAWALAPLLASIAIYTALFGLEPAMVSHVLGYVSPPNLGWMLYAAGLIQVLWPAGSSVSIQALSVAARAAILLMTAWLVWRHRAWPLERLWLATLLGFYALAPGLSVQYPLWIVPLLALIDLKQGIRYSAYAFAAIGCLYISNFPGAVPWGAAFFSLLLPSSWLLAYWIANLSWWLSCLRLLRRILREDKSLPDQAGPGIISPQRLSASFGSRAAPGSEPPRGAWQNDE